jgi:nucleoside-diphosphate-sugar epimerase
MSRIDQNLVTLHIMNATDNTSKVLVTGAGGFLGKYLMRQLSLTHNDSDIVTLGTATDNNYIADLTTSAPQLPEKFTTVYHLVGSCFGSKCHDINVDATANLLKGFESCLPRQIVYISTTEVYGKTEGEDIDETCPTLPSSAAGKAKLEAEQMLQQWCSEKGVTLSILRSPAIVGTGMQGPMRQLVNDIYRGSYHHIADDQARTSVIHAVDVAQAAVAIAPIGGIYNLTDGVNPTRHDLADALASRMGKKILTLRLSRARSWAKINDFLPFTSLNSRRLSQLTTTLTYSSNRLFEKLNWRPNSVTQYLLTHVYDENSL